MIYRYLLCTSLCMFHWAWLLVLAFQGALLCAMVIYVCSRGPFWCFHPLVLLFGLAFVDTVIPAVLWALWGIRSARSPSEPLLYGDLVSGLGVYLLGYLLFVVSFSVLNVRAAKIDHSARWVLKSRVFWVLLFLLLGVTLLELWATISEYGSAADWFAHKIKHRWDGKLIESVQPLWIRILSRFPSRAGFNLVVLVGFYYRHYLKRPLVLGLLFPLVALAIACTTFFRGSILLLILALAFVEFMRLSMLDGVSVKAAKRKATQWAVLSMVLFLLYGAIRRDFEARAWGSQGDSESYILKVINQGSGLRGISYIVKNYGEHVRYLWGKTYIDMLLFPVPRSLYTTKPEWYGIDDITRGMGWSHSTQAAVTIPGEAFANFGWCGVVFVMPVFGMFFGIMYRYCSQNRSPLMFLYPAVIMYMLFVSSWMAFTGIALRSIQLIVCVLLLKVLFRRTAHRAIHVIDSTALSAPMPGLPWDDMLSAPPNRCPTDANL